MADTTVDKIAEENENEQTTRPQFGNRTLTPDDNVFQHNAWYDLQTLRIITRVITLYTISQQLNDCHTHYLEDLNIQLIIKELKSITDFGRFIFVIILQDLKIFFL